MNDANNEKQNLINKYKVILSDIELNKIQLNKISLVDNPERLRSFLKNCYLFIAYSLTCIFCFLKMGIEKDTVSKVIVVLVISLYFGAFLFYAIIVISLFFEEAFDIAFNKIYKYFRPVQYNHFIKLKGIEQDYYSDLVKIKTQFKEQYKYDIAIAEQVISDSTLAKNKFSSEGNSVDGFDGKEKGVKYKGARERILRFLDGKNEKGKLINQSRSTTNSINADIISAPSDEKSLEDLVQPSNNEENILFPREGKWFNKIDELFIVDEGIKQLNLFDVNAEKVKQQRKISLVDFSDKSQFNSSLGVLGEEFICELEKSKLLNSDNPSLAGLVKHVSKEIGDGLGYDIESYEVNGTKKYIEVKTTTQSLDSDFFITENEFLQLKNLPNYFIYRVYEFDISSKKGFYYIINGPKDFEHYFDKKPISFRVSLKPHKRI